MGVSWSLSILLRMDCSMVVWRFVGVESVGIDSRSWILAFA